VTLKLIYLCLFALDYMCNMAVSYKRQELLTLCEHLDSPPVFGAVCLARDFSFLCSVLFVHKVNEKHFYCFSIFQSQ